MKKGVDAVMMAAAEGVMPFVALSVCFEKWWESLVAPAARPFGTTIGEESLSSLLWARIIRGVSVPR